MDFFAKYFPELSPEELRVCSLPSYISQKSSLHAIEIIEGRRQELPEPTSETQ